MEAKAGHCMCEYYFQKYLEEDSSLVDGIVGFHDAIRKCESFAIKTILLTGYLSVRKLYAYIHRI